MLIIQANGKEYQCPESLRDVTFRQYSEYLNIAATAPKLLTELSDLEVKLLNVETMTDDEIDGCIGRIDEIHNKLSTGNGKKQYTEFKIRVVGHFIGMSYGEMIGRNGINIDSLNQMYSLITNALQIKEDNSIIESLDIHGIKYEIASGAQITLGDFLEAAQIEELNRRLDKGSHETMIDICAVLLRREGEDFSDDVFKRNKEDFAELDMETVSRIAFFLHTRNETQLKIVVLSSLTQAVENLKAARRNALDGILS